MCHLITNDTIRYRIFQQTPRIIAEKSEGGSVRTAQTVTALGGGVHRVMCIRKNKTESKGLGCPGALNPGLRQNSAGILASTAQTVTAHGGGVRRAVCIRKNKTESKGLGCPGALNPGLRRGSAGMFASTAQTVTDHGGGVRRAMCIRKNKTGSDGPCFIFGGDEGARTHDLTDVNRAL